MTQATFTVRLMSAEDFDAVVAIDRRVLGVSREQYYESKFEKLLGSQGYLPVSHVAENEDGKVVGFVMGELYLGEYGILEDQATLDTIGVDPEFQNLGIGQQLVDEFVDHVRSLGVRKLFTMVTWNDSGLVRFFSENQFAPSNTINLERQL